MKAIGPYVVNREVSPVRRSDPAEATLPLTSRTLWVTDRLTGMPALLHELPTPMPAPELPRSAWVLPFSDLVVEGSQAYLVTELPLNAVPASDPVLAARATLAALETLHSHGLAHGGLDSGQLWSVDGQVMVVGGGLHRLDRQFTVARDLQDLATTLDDLGGLPPILSLLRNPSDTLSAREARQLLEAGLQAQPSHAPQPEAAPVTQGTVLPAPSQPEPYPVEQDQADRRLTRQPSLPTLNPMSLLDSSAPLPQQGPYLWQASWTPLDPEVPPPAQVGIHAASSVTASSTGAGGLGRASETKTANIGAFGETFQLDISEWTFPEFLDGAATTTPAAPPPPVVVTSAPVVLQWAAPNRIPATTPQTTAQPVEQQSAVPPVAPTSPKENSAATVAAAAAEPTFSAPARRGARAAAARALDRLRADSTRLQNMAEVRRDHLPSQWQAVVEGTVAPLTEPTVSETPQERRRREYEATLEQHQFDAQTAAERQQRLSTEPELPPLPTQTVSRRQLKPIKATWTKDQTWKVVHDGETPDARERSILGPGAPTWLLPLLLALVLALVAGLLVYGSRHKVSAVSPAAACCNVEFRLRGQGATGKTARLTLESAPPEAKLTVGQQVGTAPGAVHLPVAGKYRVRVATDGFTPASVDFVVPSSQPVMINLGN